MEEIEFTLNGKRYRLSRKKVQDAVQGVEPNVIYDLAVWVNERWYPAKQPFYTALGQTYRDVNSRTALGHLSRLGFPSHDAVTEGPRPDRPNGSAQPAATPEIRRLGLTMAVETAKARGGATAAEVLTVADEYVRWLLAA